MAGRLETGMYRVSAKIGDLEITVDRRDERVALGELIRRLNAYQAQKEKETANAKANDAMKSFWDDKRDIIEQSIEKLFQMIIKQDS